VPLDVPVQHREREGELIALRGQNQLMQPKEVAGKLASRKSRKAPTRVSIVQVPG
jgi:hypothetical protein